jgi:hypothetical protein
MDYNYGIIIANVYIFLLPFLIEYWPFLVFYFIFSLFSVYIYLKDSCSLKNSIKMTEENASKGVKSIDLECTGDTCKVRRPERPTERPTEKTTIGSQGNPNKKGILKPDTPIEKIENPLVHQKIHGTPQTKWQVCHLMETNGQENESWYNFIKYEGNERL